MLKFVKNITSKDSGLSWNEKRVSSDNLGQNIADEFSKLKKIGFSVKCFRGQILQVSSAIVKILILGDQLSTCL